MIRGVLGSRASIGGGLGSGRGGAAAWYLAGGVSAADCVAAYTPKGAASLAASYDNNAAPGNGLADGTYDAAPGTAPTFDTATGWSFAAASSQFLTTGIVPASSTWSIFVRFSDAAASFGALVGAYEASGTKRFFVDSYETGTNQRRYGNGGILRVTPYTTSGVMGFAGSTAYLNGANSGTIAGGSVPAIAMMIGASNNDGAPQYKSAKIQAVAIYNVTLDAATVAAISAAMAVL